LIGIDLLLLDWNIKELLGKDKMVVNLRGSEATIRGLIKKLDEEYGGKVWEAISRPNIFIFVNGQDIEFLRGIDTILSDGDRVAIMPLAAGG